MTRRASFYSLGCRLNQSESDSLASGLVAKGYRVVPEGEEAELCVINTCSVTEQSDAKCRHLIRSILRRAPETFVVVTGCYAQSGVEALRSVSGIDMIVGTEQKMEIPRLLPEVSEPLFKETVPRVLHTTKIGRKNFIIDTYAAYDRATRPNIKIQDGCDFFCAFCIIPYTRGRERSRAFEDVLNEARAWSARGHREVVL
ncbi:MAG TPA: tRNA (N(6)-L-threonylcarbamoyladenosine(37)-C(2))-methylthiotransferase MtaB, partial [Nitrospiria bacterium]|nr:tRNA (N(6)-L-threonylcarbamoyladenosine(37)-C(2))-methylthiotransferase MtaB [Nitrospiria bacterium]